MIDQLLAQLDEMPECTGDFKIEHLGVGFTALCVRWGTYLAALMDASTELHPAIPSFHKPQPEEYGFISDSEMKRMNIWKKDESEAEVKYYCHSCVICDT